MCNSVTIGTITAETPRDLAILIGDQNIVWRERNPFSRWPEGKNWKNPDRCLCPVDLNASLTKARLRWKRSDIDPMEYLVTTDNGT